MFNHLLRLVRNRSLTQYLASHPTAYNELVAAVHDIPPPKPLLTPASTPHDRDLPDEHAPSPPPSLPITREEEPICDNGCWDDTCVNDTDGPRAAQMNDRSLLNHDPPAALNNDGYTAETVDTTEHASSKRKQAFQDGSPSKRRHFECTGRAWSGADTRVSAVVLIQRTWRSREQVKAWRQYRHKVVLIQSLWRGKQACFVYNKYKQKIIYIQSFWRGKRDLRAYKEYRRKIVNIQSWWRGKHARQGDKETREVATSTASDSLSTEWRLAIQHISSIRVLEDCQEFCRQIRNPISRIDIRVDQDALKGDAGSQRDSASEQRLAQLKILITNTEEKEKSIKSLARVFQVWRRMHVVELANRYIEEVKAEDVAPKQGWRPSVMDRFTDVLFPDTIKHNGKSKGRRLSERKGKKRKGKQVSKEERKQVSEQEKKRKKAVRKVEYWKRLGMGLLGPVQCYGHGILILLSKDLTETR